MVNEKGKAFEADLIVTDSKAGSPLKQEEGAWVHGKREGRHMQWGVSGQVDLDVIYKDGLEQKKESQP